jgi:hypothetical protein
MKGFLIFILIASWLGVLFFGYIQIVQKSMKDNSYNNPLESRKLIDQNKQKNQDLLEQQKRLLDHRKDRMRNTRF